MFSIKKFSKVNKFNLSIFSIFLFFVLFFQNGIKVEAASLNISPSSGSVSVGQNIVVRVLVDSANQSINAVSGQVTFTNNILELTNISKSGVVSLWAQDPTYSNSAGTASFQGVILNGYTGGAGRVVTLTFKAKAMGQAHINISKVGSSVLLNDGAGTNVLSSENGATFTVNKAIEKVVKPAPPVVTPVAETPPPAPVEQVPAPVVPAPVVEKPIVFTDYQSPLLPGSFVVVKGTATPDSLVNITFSRILDNGGTTVISASVKSSDSGNFTYVSDEKVVEGSTYTIFASSTLSSARTDLLTLPVKNSLTYILISLVKVLLGMQMSIALALLIMLLISGYLLYRNRVLKQQLKRAKEAPQKS